MVATPAVVVPETEAERAPVERLPITLHPSVVCESCERNQGALLVVLPRDEDDVDEGAGRPRFVVCSPCGEVA